MRGLRGPSRGLASCLRESSELTWLSVSISSRYFQYRYSLISPPPTGPGTKGFYHGLVDGASHIKRLIKDVLGEKDLRRFFASYFVYIDGVNTIIYFAAIFAATTLGFR